MYRWIAWAAVLAVPTAAWAWSPAARELATRAEREFPGRIVVVASVIEAAARGVSDDAQRRMREAESEIFPAAAAKGVVAPFRRHWFDVVRCAIYIPPDAADPDAEFWA